MVRFTLTIDGDEEIDRTLAAYTTRVQDLRPLFATLADRFATVEAGQFASQGALGSGGWAPLSPAYAAWKARRYPGAGILHRTGTLAASLTTRPFGVEDITRDQAVFGTRVPYAGYHQAGTDRMPPRPPIQFPDSEKRAWVTAIQRFLHDGSTQ